MKKLDELIKKREQIELDIKETQKRLPAHSIKPPVMMDLLNLEDEYDRISDEIRKLQQTGNNR